MAAMGAIGLGVYEANPAPTRNFPIFNNNSEVVYPEYVQRCIDIILQALLMTFHHADLLILSVAKPVVE